MKLNNDQITFQQSNTNESYCEISSKKLGRIIRRYHPQKRMTFLTL